jgi:hypothetical protein
MPGNNFSGVRRFYENKKGQLFKTVLSCLVDLFKMADHL